MVRVAPILEDSQNVLYRLGQLYQYELSGVSGIVVDKEGRFPLPYFDWYWREEHRFPFFIWVAEKLAGFALVRHMEDGTDPYHMVSEFFVLKGYRRRGVGREAARQLFDRFPGRWLIQEEEFNVGAQAFWRQTLRQLGAANLREVRVESWDGPAQRFTWPPLGGESAVPGQGGNGNSA